MESKTLNKWIMYHEIHKLSRMGFSKAKIGRHLSLDALTVKRVLSLTEQEYEQY